jgi:hypothetical protein
MKAEKEKEILQIALDAFKKIAQVEIEVEEARANQQGDYLLKIALAGKRLRYLAEVKATIAKPGFALLLMRKEKYAHNLLLVTRYVNPHMAEELKTEGLEFIDTAGNAYLNQPPVYIYVKGNRPPDEIMPPTKKTAFKPTGLKVIYAFLCNPGLENKPYRDIAAQADVALGTVGWLMRDLKERGYLLDMGKKGNKIIQKENLLQRWVEAYPERLRPKLVIGRFHGEQGWWEQRNMQPGITFWGGEVAAARMTKYLKPQIVTLYTDKQALNNVLLENRLKKDLHGDVEVLKRFWGPGEAFQNDDMVHPILVYADLIATGNQRNRETARMIYERDIARLVRED